MQRHEEEGGSGSGEEDGGDGGGRTAGVCRGFPRRCEGTDCARRARNHGPGEAALRRGEGESVETVYIGVVLGVSGGQASAEMVSRPTLRRPAGGPTEVVSQPIAEAAYQPIAEAQPVER
jgi:hypothetical protein